MFGRHTIVVWRSHLYPFVHFSSGLGLDQLLWAYVVMAYIVLASIVMGYIVTAYVVVAYEVMAYIVMAHIVVGWDSTSCF